jgi:1,4-dihydroxy-2-naphthoyl-CoA hydrolase
MQIWKNPVTVDQLNTISRNSIHDSLGIEFTQVGDDYLEAKMVVDARTKNPPGILHGGASVVLAESLGSVASILVAGFEDKTCVGVEINANHLNSMKDGIVFGKVTPLRLGRTLHVWDIQIRDGNTSDFRLVCQSRLTVMVKDKN